MLEATTKTEDTEWWSATKRRKTNMARGRKPGRMPRFRSAKNGDARFVCWCNNGRNAIHAKTGRRSGTVTIAGQNPPGHREHGTRWKLVFHVRLSQRIRGYTSVRVNLTKNEVVFVNPPLPVDMSGVNGEVVGLDRGVVHTVATSDGDLHDAPDTSRLEKKRRWHQKQMARSRRVAETEGRNFWESKRYQAHKTAAAKLSARQARIREDFAHKVSRSLVERYALIGIEDLRVANMTRRGRGTGAAAKRGLNRSMNNAALARLADFIEYKADPAGTLYIKVNPAYTSQRCHRCDHSRPENRETQAIFRCKDCGWTGNADINAAINIRDRALGVWQPSTNLGEDYRPAGSKSKTDPQQPWDQPTRLTASAMNREPLTAPTG